MSSGLKSDMFVGACDLGSRVGHESMLEALNALTEATNNEDNVRNSMIWLSQLLVVGYVIGNRSSSPRQKSTLAFLYINHVAPFYPRIGFVGHIYPFSLIVLPVQSVIVILHPSWDVYKSHSAPQIMHEISRDYASILYSVSHE